MMKQVAWAGQTLELFPEKAIFWKEGSALLVADVHFGKAQAFRHYGIPVPPGTTAENLAKLSHLLAFTEAKKIIFLGDFLHAKVGRGERTMEAIASWRREKADIEMILVGGNHDLHAGEPEAAWNFRCVSEPYTHGPFQFCHDPKVLTTLPAFAGHVHPAYRLVGVEGTSITAPCFWFRKDRVVLPSFGSFTGGFLIQPVADEILYLVGGDAVVPFRPRVASSSSSAR